MPITLPTTLPAFDVLRNEGVMVMSPERAMAQEIRPLRIGLLNLMPLPVLDGGHLLYYLWEGVSGRGISDLWMERLQRGGVALLLAMMTVALFNDVTRLFG